MLQEYAKIATKSLMLRDREDRMQDAIVHVLEKNLQDHPKNYILRSMRNRVLWDLREEWRTRKEAEPYTETYDLPSPDFFLNVGWFSDLSPRNQVFLLGCAFCGLTYVSERLSIPYFTVRAKFQRLRHEVKEILYGKNSAYKSR